MTRKALVWFAMVSVALFALGCGGGGTPAPPTGGGAETSGPGDVDLINECEADNGGCEQTCTDAEDGFTCGCDDGFALAEDGLACANIDDCSDSPCQNGGTCTDGVAVYTCECPEGYSGADCGLDIDECVSEPCQNGGVCTDGVASYTCECAAGFDGADCETNIDDCVDAPCLNEGTCVDGVASYSCECADGYEGADCETDIDDCADSPCQNGGTCTDGVASYGCECVEGFDGADCESNIDDCADSPCQNGGVCTDGVASYTCECAEGYGGEDCAQCTDLHIVKTGPVKTIPTAGVRVVFSVETCDGDPVPDLLEQGSMEIINDETGKPFGSEGDAAPSVGEAKDFSFYTIVVLDLSYSVVNNGSLEAELNGAISLVEQLVEQPQDDRQKHNVALYVFGSTSQSELLQGFTKNHALLYQHLEALKSDPGKGSTNLYGAYKTALDLIELQGLDEEKVQRSVILMTDGTHETGDADELEAESLVKLSESTANVYTIGLAGDYDEEKLQVLASAPENFLLASEASELVAAFQSIAAAVAAWAKSNYVLGVCSPLEGPDRSLTLTATYGLMTGSVTAEYDATGFDLTGCDPVYVADPCGAVDCGVMEGLQCNSCSGELVCIENFCEDKLCVPDALYCAGQTVMQCDGEGASASPVSSCNSSSEFCKQQGDDAWCTPHVCDPGEPFCDGDTSYTCNSEGSGSEEDTEINCSSAGLLCNAGICTSQICVPSTKFCEDNAVQKCNGDGSDYLELDACTGSEYCEENPPTASCNAPSPLGSEDNPAQSCKEILDAGASTGDGMYWIDPDGFGQAPNYSPFEVHCDMTTDGGGWIRIAQTDGAINIDANDYLNGFEPSPACAEVGLPALDECETHVIDCHKYSALQTSAATFLVKMGNVKDYYRPKGAFSFCEMLVSHNRHLWNNQATGVFEQPCYSNTPHLGGSCGSLKPDGRWFLSNWGDDSWYNNLGGCCSLDYGSTDGEWGDPFEFFVREAAPTIPDGYLGSQENPAQSCKEILDAGASTGDGMYWLDWGTSGGFQAKCDMSGANAGFTRLNTPLLKSADLVDFITPYTEPAGQSWWDESGGFVLTPYNGNSNCQGIVVRAEVVVPSGFQEWFGSWSAIGHASGTNCDDHFNPFPLNMWGDSDTSVSCGGWIKFGTENHLSKQGGEWGIDWSPGAVIKHWDWLQQDIPTSTLIRWEVGDDKEIDMVRFFDIDIWIR